MPPRIDRHAFVLASLVLTACAAPRGIPVRGETHYEHATGRKPAGELAVLWVSYQLELVSIDGVATDYRAKSPGLYYRVDLPPGEHTLSVRLNYQAPLQVVRLDAPVATTVSLAPGGAYKLIDLNAGRSRDRVLVPWLEPGAPPDEQIEVRRPSS